MLNRNDFARFMFIALSIETEAWAYDCKGTLVQRDKQLLEQFIVSAKLLRKQLERSIDMTVVNELSEVFSKCLELIANEQDIQKKNELFAVMEAWSKGLVDKHEDQIIIDPGKKIH